jgi:hypothetical protein
MAPPLSKIWPSGDPRLWSVTGVSLPFLGGSHQEKEQTEALEVMRGAKVPLILL